MFDQLKGSQLIFEVRGFLVSRLLFVLEFFGILVLPVFFFQQVHVEILLLLFHAVFLLLIYLVPQDLRLLQALIHQLPDHCLLPDLWAGLRS